MAENADEDVISITDEETIELLMDLAKRSSQTPEEALYDALKREAEKLGIPVK